MGERGGGSVAPVAVDVGQEQCHGGDQGDEVDGAAAEGDAVEVAKHDEAREHLTCRVHARHARSSACALTSAACTAGAVG